MNAEQVQYEADMAWNTFLADMPVSVSEGMHGMDVETLTILRGIFMKGFGEGALYGSRVSFESVKSMLGGI